MWLPCSWDIEREEKENLTKAESIMRGRETPVGGISASCPPLCTKNLKYILFSLTRKKQDLFPGCPVNLLHGILG